MQKPKILNQIIRSVLLMAAICGALFLYSPGQALALPAPEDTGTGASVSNPNCANTPDAQAVQDCVKSDPIVKDIQTIVNFLSAVVGVVVVIMVIVGGIQYSIAGD